METQGRYLLVGAFTLLGFLGLLVVLLWLTRLDLARETRLYAIDFPTVAGLSNASDVRFAGFGVGQVRGIALSADHPGRVRVTVEVAADTPVRTDSLATIEPQGMTGVTYVAISAGSDDAPLLVAASDLDVPLIPAGRSSLQSVTEAAPDLLAETLGLMRELRELTGDENRDRIGRILGNVETASAKFSDALEDVSSVSETVAVFAAEIGAFNASLDALAGDASGTLSAAEDAFAAVEATAADATGVLADARAALAEATQRIASVGDDISDAAQGIADLSDRAGDGIDAVQAELSDLSGRARTTLDRGEGSLDAFDRTLAAIRDVAEPGKAAALAAERTFDAAGRAIADDLPGLIEGLGATARTLDEAAALIAQDLPRIASDIRAAGVSARTMLADVETTVRAVSPAVRRFAEGGLPQYAQLATDLRATVANLDRLLERLGRDPGRFFLEPRAPEYRR